MPAHFLQDFIAKQPPEVRHSFKVKPNGRVAKLVVADAKRAWCRSVKG